MVKKEYTWKEGAILEEHSRIKHKILEEYFRDYLKIRCTPRSRAFRFAVVDGFAGGGEYKCGTKGSPIILIETLLQTLEEINIHRQEIGIKSPIDIECTMVFNDLDEDADEMLRELTAPLLANAKANHPNLLLNVIHMNAKFEDVYPEIFQLLKNHPFHNVLFNLDQCGHSKIYIETLHHIINNFKSAEIFFTFAINSLIAFLPQSESKKTDDMARIGLDKMHEILSGPIAKTKKEWLGEAERFVFEIFKQCAPFVSHFAINNPGGWYYWLIHLANGSYRARQAYNNVLHNNSNHQAHFGRSGLHMLAHDPSMDDGLLYGFDHSGRMFAKKQLLIDIPRFISDAGNEIQIDAFRNAAYNMTPSHSDDIDAAILENPELKLVTESGSLRQKAARIKSTDRIVLKRQMILI